MPRVIDYAVAAPHLLARGFVSLYHNSGAFGFARSAKPELLGWIGPDDGSIRAEVRPFSRGVEPPYPSNLAGMLIAARRHLPGEAWLMPKSHWHFELHDGHPALLSGLLPEIGIAPALLRERNDGSPVAFGADENELLRHAVERLLGGMRFSDFLIAFPDARALCTVHHHTQLWWQSIDPIVIDD